MAAEAETMIRDYSWDTFTNHELVSQPRNLTDYGANTPVIGDDVYPDSMTLAWNCMENKLVQMLSEYLVRKRNEALQSRYHLLLRLLFQIESETDSRDPFPAPGDILTDPRIEALIWDTPYDKRLGDSLCKSKLLEYLPSIIDEWRPAKIQEVLEILRTGRPSATVSDLHLATSVFACSSCTVKALHYPQMFYHRCCHQRSLTSSRSDHCLDVYVPFWFTKRPLGHWMSSTLVYNDSGSQDIKKVIEACNLDPETTTVDDLHLANPLIECLSCKTHGRRHFMRWPYLPIQHMGHSFQVNSFDTEMTQILAREIPSHDRKAICCAHCHETFGLKTFELHAGVLGIDCDTLTTDLLHIRKHLYWNSRAIVPGSSRPFVYVKA
ncbi:hypothetical protein BDP27DRAFT_1446496 [Rhodocollybia butyracea]|uniref:Uncharacterized protein n=1 Tax=Rhodocollybia butyracea TaxID=206335 RepID=A0A9P5PS28_9AGAR|nr:hypothetical protein BDP27DRAFT_1446496 [Rhodocollybia butyracea]